MKIFSVLIMIINIESLDKITKNAHLEENLPVLLQKLKENLQKNSALLPFEKLKEQLIVFKNTLQKYLVKETEKTFGPRTILKELVDKLSCSTALIEYHDFEDTIDRDELQEISEELKIELKALLDIFGKKIGEKSFEHQDNGNFKVEFIKQYEELFAYLENSLSEDFDLPKGKEFEKEVKRQLISLEKILNTHLNKTDLVQSEFAVFSKELNEKLDSLIEILNKNCNGDHHNNLNITPFGFKIQGELTSLCDFLFTSLNVDLKAQSESKEIRPDLYEKLASLVNFLTDSTSYKSENLTVHGVNPTPLVENSGVELVTSRQISPENTKTPLALTDSVPPQNPQIDHENSSINLHNNSVLTDSNGSIHKIEAENQHHNGSNIQGTLFSIEIEKSSEGPDLQTSPITHHSDTNLTPVNLSQETLILSPGLELQDQPGKNISFLEFSPENLSIIAKDTKDELEPEKNMTTSVKSLQEESPEVLSINTKDETMLESQQSENSNNTIQGDDPKISEAFNLSNDEQLVLQNENSILRNTNKDQNKEKPSQISKDNVKKELGKTNEDSLHKNGLAIEKDELKNNKASEVEKKIEKIVEDVDIPEKNKTKQKITEDLKTDLPKKKYDNLKKFANNHSKKKNLLKGVQQKTVSNNDSKTLHTKKDKQLEDSSPIEVLNNHKKSIVEDAHDNSSILRVNGNVSAGKKIKDDGKPQNSVQKNDFISFKVKPFLNGIIPAITLNFTISRRVL